MQYNIIKYNYDVITHLNNYTTLLFWPSAIRNYRTFKSQSLVYLSQGNIYIYNAGWSEYYIIEIITEIALKHEILIILYFVLTATLLDASERAKRDVLHTDIINDNNITKPLTEIGITIEKNEKYFIITYRYASVCVYKC